MGLCLEPKDKILVVSPHPDDESIACGGVLSLYRGQCDVLLATDGFRKDLNNREQSETRVREFMAATDCLGVCQRFLLHIPEQEIPRHRAEFEKVDFRPYRVILVPNRHEEHEDHAALYRMIRKVARKQAASAELLEYEVWTTLRHPNVKVDISSVAEQKAKAIECHQSQIKELDYVGMSLGLNAYRGKGHGCDCAEVFYSESRAKRQKKKRMKQKIKSLLDRIRRPIPKK